MCVSKKKERSIKDGACITTEYFKAGRGRMGGKAFLVALGICGVHEKLTLKNKCLMPVKCGLQH